MSVPKPDSVEDMVGYIDSVGAQIVPPRYVAGGFFSAGLAGVVDTDERTAFIDARGRIAIPASFMGGLGGFFEGLCAIGSDTAVGYIATNGEWAIRPEYLVCGRFSEGLASVSYDGEHFGVINRKGQIVVAPRYEGAGRFLNGLASVRIDGKWGYIDPAGSLIVPCMFDGPRAQPFTGGWAGVSIESRWGFVDRYGTWLVKPQYDDVGRFSEGLAPVKVGEKWGALNTSGALQLAPMFDDLEEFEGGMAPASRDGKSGFVSPEGRWIIEPRFDRCYRFVGDLAVVKVGDRYGYISRSGESVWTSEPGALTISPPFQE